MRNWFYQQKAIIRERLLIVTIILKMNYIVTMTENSNLFTVKCFFFTDWGGGGGGGGGRYKIYSSWQLCKLCICMYMYMCGVLEGDISIRGVRCNEAFWLTKLILVKKKMNTGSILSACENSLLYPPLPIRHCIFYKSGGNQNLLFIE